MADMGDEARDACITVVDKHIVRIARPARREVRAGCHKGDQPVICPEYWQVAQMEQIIVAADRDTRCCARQPVADVQVQLTVNASQTGGIGPEADIAAIGRYRRPAAPAVGLLAAAADRHALGDAGVAIVDEAVKLVIGIARHQIAGMRAEGHKTPIG